MKATLEDQIKAAQKRARGIRYIKGNIASGKAKCFTLKNGVVYFGNRIVVPKNKNLRQLILKEAHESPLLIHPGGTKMYQDLCQRFCWTRMKREIAQFVVECDVCHRVKAEHQRPAGTLQPLSIPEWKWTKSVWTSSPAFQRPRKEMMPSSLSLTDFQSCSLPSSSRVNNC